MTPPADSAIVMHRLAMPSDPAIIQALGALVIAHTQLELVMRYTIKTLSREPNVDVALNQTKGFRMNELRQRIRQLFTSMQPTDRELHELNTLLEQARRLSKKRNDYAHSTWSATEAGESLMHDVRHRWGPAPTVEEMRQVTLFLVICSNALNYNRLHGFIAAVVKRRAGSATKHG